MFKQMENTTNFIRACRTLGVQEKDVFSTVDLYEAKFGRTLTAFYLIASNRRTGGLAATRISFSPFVSFSRGEAPRLAANRACGLSRFPCLGPVEISGTFSF